MSTVELTYDADKHGIAVKEPGHKSVAFGCTYHGPEIEELSAGDLVATGVAGCMLFSMGVQARQDELDIKGTVVDVAFTMTDKRSQWIASGWSSTCRVITPQKNARSSKRQLDGVRSRQVSAQRRASSPSSTTQKKRLL